ncbi:PEP-CTERM sorting domain-containing protein [Coraliomargarita parva]|uniref:PEP-CTERM sorting domain-containing protein n=1 Tax=Coraliomargarita parva TaxID=3014050 RepID=UPI0022B2FA62|nr:PEP-CTERM sorting domain-containing protein [Coraliomargarita parva]
MTIKTCTLSRALLIAAGMLTAYSASAQTTIFEDNFSDGYGSINGTTPTTDLTGTATWTTPSYVGQNGGLLYGRLAGTGAAASTGYLAYTLSAGNIYELSVDIAGAPPTSDTSQYAGIGFFSTVTSTTVPYHQQDSGNPTGAWMFLRTQNTDANEGDLSFRPLGTGGSAIDSTFDVTVSRNYKLVLNTSDTDAAAGTQFSLALFVDNVQYGTSYTYTDAESSALLANVVGVGLTALIASGGPDITFDNFLLTSTAVVPEPGTFALLAGLTAFAAIAMRRRK